MDCTDEWPETRAREGCDLWEFSLVCDEGCGAGFLLVAVCFEVAAIFLFESEWSRTDLPTAGEQGFLAVW